MDCRGWCWEREGRVLRWTAGSERAAGRAVPWRPSCGLLAARSNIHLRAGRGSRQDSTTSALLVGFGFVAFDLACSLTEGTCHFCECDVDEAPASRNVSLLEKLILRLSECVAGKQKTIQMAVVRKVHRLTLSKVT